MQSVPSPTVPTRQGTAAAPPRPSALRAVASTLRHGVDHLLHPWRRWWARRLLSRMDRPDAVLFVCSGNIYRSPFAALVLQRRLRSSGITVTSAGFIGPDRPAPADAVDAAAARGIELGAHRSALLPHGHLERAGLVVVMEPAQRPALRARFPASTAPILLLGDFDPEPILTRRIVDPWRRPHATLLASYARIERCAGELARLIDHMTPP